MMKLYADLFELTAESISAKSIRRLRWMAIGSLPFIPMIVFWIVNGLPKSTLIVPFLLIFVLCAILTVSVLLARLVNRVWSPDKYLDEWEKDLKRRSMTMAFMVVMYVALSLVVFWELLNGFLPSFATENSGSTPLLFLLAIVGAGFYTQIFTQLSLIVPMEEDELEKPQYVVTTVRSVLGILVVIIVAVLSIAMALGFYSGHRAHNVEHAAAQEACGETKVDTHEKTDASIEVTCEGSDDIIQLDPETLKPI